MLQFIALLALSQLDGGTPNSDVASQSSDAGVRPFSAAIYAACPDASDAGAAYHDETLKAWVLPDPRGPRTACLLAACEEDRKLPRGEGVTPTWVWVVTTVVDVALKGGIAVVTWAATRAATVPPPAP